MKKFKLINFNTQNFVSEKEVELKLYRWEKVKIEYIAKLKAKRLPREDTTKTWNIDGIGILGHLFEYEDEKAYKKCKPIFEEIEKKEKEDQLIKVFADRGIVLEEFDFRHK